MAGYTPVFDSVFHGTLCGKWPTLPVWLTILPMTDKHGQIDMTYQAMSALSGWPIDLLKTAIAELMLPDAESRSDAAEGRRLELIDPENRQWGWRVVNHRVYREKARLMSKDSARTESGKDAQRKKSPAVPRCPPDSPAVPLSDADADTNKKKNPLPPEGGLVVPGLDLASWERFVDYRKSIRKPIKPVSIPAAQRELAGYGPVQNAVVEQSIANSWTGLFALKRKPNGKVSEWE